MPSGQSTSSCGRAPRHSMIAATVSGQFSGCTPSASPTSYASPVPARSNTTCRVSFCEPGRFSGMAASSLASTCRRVPAAAARRPRADDGDCRGRPQLHQFLEGTRCLLAAGDAAREVPLRAAGDRRRVGLAQIAALAAILLRHRRHELVLERPALGELHPLVERAASCRARGGSLRRRRRRARARPAQPLRNSPRASH